MVIFKKTVYNDCVGHLFKDENKFCTVKTDDTLTKLGTVQSYLRCLKNRNEITEDEFDAMKPKSATLSRAYGLPKIHKTFDIYPKFRPVIDTMFSPYSDIGKYLADLLRPLTFNEFSVRDSFDAAEKIRATV